VAWWKIKETELQPSCACVQLFADFSFRTFGWKSEKKEWKSEKNGKHWQRSPH